MRAVAAPADARTRALSPQMPPKITGARETPGAFVNIGGAWWEAGSEELR